MSRAHPNASAEYKQQRDALLQAEAELRDHVEEVAELRRQLPLGPAVSYTLTTGDPDVRQLDDIETRVDITSLFQPGHTTLVVYHLMYGPDADSGCPMCSSWIDGLNGVAPHFGQHLSFVVVAKAQLGKLRAWSRQRGWDRVRVVSSHNTAHRHIRRRPRVMMPNTIRFVG